MAGFNLELPTEVIGSINKLYDNAEDMMKQMTRAGAEVVFNNIQNNMKRSFKTTDPKTQQGRHLQLPLL